MKNIYYRYINFPFEFQKPREFLDSPSIYQIGNEIEDCRNTELMLDFLKNFNLSIGSAEGFYTLPKGKIPIHTDGISTSKINITWGPENGLIQFYKPNKIYNSIGEIDISSGIRTNYDNTVKFAKEEESKLVCEVNTNRPTLLNVEEFHGTYNPDTKNGRWTLAYTIVDQNDTPVHWFSVINILKDYLEESLM